MFINTTEDLAESEVDAIVDMDLEDDLEASVRRAVEGCISVIGLEKPEEGKIQEALDVVKGYVPAKKKRDDVRERKDIRPRYYGLLAEVELVEVLQQRLGLLGSDTSQVAVPAIQSLGKLIDAGRVSKRPHVTIVHQNSLPGEVALWDRCMKLHDLNKPPLFKGKLGHLVWDERVMAVTVEGLEVVDDESEDGGKDRKGNRLGREFLDSLSEEVRDRLHITVGTQSQGIPAVEAKTLVERFRMGKLNGCGVLELDGTVVHGRIKGLMS
jgi:tRNA ligase